MKVIYVLSFCLLAVIWKSDEEKSTKMDLKKIIGKWKLDMSPNDKTDSNFAMMEITKITDGSFEGEFYRDGVKIQNANVNTQLGIIYCALVSGDGSGTYNTTFYYKDGMLQGTTHAVGRNFLSVWTATKEQ